MDGHDFDKLSLYVRTRLGVAGIDREGGSDEARHSLGRHGTQEKRLRVVTFVHSEVKVSFRYQAITPTTIVVRKRTFTSVVAIR